MSNFSDFLENLPSGLSINYVELTTSGSWTVPATAKYVRALVIAGGGSGGSNSTSNPHYAGSGGGGGGAIILEYDTADLPASVTYSIGAGGAAVIGTAPVTGNNGGNSIFNGIIVEGGKGGGSTNGGGAGGSVWYNPDVYGTNGKYTGGDSVISDGDTGGKCLANSSSYYGLPGVTGGGGGGPGAYGYSVPYLDDGTGGDSLYGGAGGGGGGAYYNATQEGVGGTSKFGGNGGTGGLGSTSPGNGQNGSVGGGGGGGAGSGYTSGAGGNGIIKIWWWA